MYTNTPHLFYLTKGEEFQNLCRNPISNVPAAEPVLILNTLQRGSSGVGLIGYRYKTCPSAQ